MGLNTEEQEITCLWTCIPAGLGAGSKLCASWEYLAMKPNYAFLLV